MVRSILAGLLALVLACCAVARALAAPPLFVEASVEPQVTWVHAQAVYTLRFYHAVDVGPVRLDGPQVRLAELRPLGEGRRYEIRRDGVRYRVHEARYAVFPFASGNLQIGGAAVRGKRPGRDAFQLSASPVPLTVQPALPVPDRTASWLPAEAVQLAETPALPAVVTLRPGDVLSRTLVIEARGADASVLPELRLEADGFRVLAEPPHLSNRTIGNRNVGRREQRFSLVATRSGSLRLPELQLVWWDTVRSQWAREHLPGSVVEASGKPGADAVSLAAPARRSHQLALLLALFSTLVAAWLGYPVLCLWRLRRRVLIACASHDPKSTRDALLAWGGFLWSPHPSRSLQALRERVSSSEFAESLGALERQLYGAVATPWRGDALARALREESSVVKLPCRSLRLRPLAALPAFRWPMLG